MIKYGLILLLTSSIAVDTFIVNVDQLNIRDKPSLESSIVYHLSAGEEVSRVENESIVESGGRKWVKIFSKVNKNQQKGWVDSQYLTNTELFEVYKPGQPKAIIYPSIDNETAYYFSPDGTYKIIRPERIDGNYYGCSSNEKNIQSLCVEDGGRLYIFKNLIWAKGRKLFQLKNNSVVCSFKQSALEPGEVDFSTCSNSVAALKYTDLFPEDFQKVDNTEAEKLLLGEHVLTLQHLKNHGGIGKATIYKKNGEIVIDGYQEEQYKGSLNYMSIKGRLNIITPKVLHFEGKIITKISYINSGVPYERNGTYRLVASGSRKYWRMQNMAQPYKKISVRDYIDLYFEKFK